MLVYTIEIAEILRDVFKVRESEGLFDVSGAKTPWAIIELQIDYQSGLVFSYS